MNTRRPPSRAKPNSSSALPPPQPQRSRSATSKSVSLTRSADEQPGLAAPPTKLHKHSDEPDTNIQVVIRCRRRSDREIQDNSPIIVNSSGARSNQVSIETTAPVSTLGVVQLPPVRTYPFDLVYGPEADQALIYHDVVGPMLEQVLEGYNCTLFAYGQTGTGKTYTMQGDLTPTPMGNPSSHAGMIPRVLFRLFHQLEQSKIDFSVRVSYIELYNEELRDLLANDLAAPIGNTQPMGMGSKDSTKNGGSNIKIFDDSSKRGVVIQGIEDIPVKSSADALVLLTKGSERRQIAATKFNDHSSRSHSIFSLTVHTKEPGVVGEDLLRIGKLNMVDLAGSENIGRSGAENKRAREAGMINQSLLTLGRVINALVDKAQHVPYRESKLTRILQDSLGGRTKTSIIATVSPARSNLEETLSTLDYAMSAKSIRNKPEINQRMTRNSLLKEYIAEIERLKADVLAAREKNGIFFSEESWAQIDAERELRETQIEEGKKQVEIIENHMRAVREEFEQSIGLLMKRDSELKDTRQRLNDTESRLSERETELKGVQVALDEEVVVRHAHQRAEHELDSVATELKSVAKESIHDVSALFEKLERKASILGTNSSAVIEYTHTLSTASKSLVSTLDDFIGSSSQFALQLQENARTFHVTEVKTLDTCSNRVNEQLQNVLDVMQIIRKQDGIEAAAMNSLEALLKDTYSTFGAGFELWSESLQKTCKHTHEELDRVSSQALSETHTAVRDIHGILEHVLRETAKFFEREQETLSKANTVVRQSIDDEVERLREQNRLLMTLVEKQKVESNKSKDDLLQRVSGLLVNFVNEQDRGLREAIVAVQEANDVSGNEMKALNQHHGEMTTALERERASIISLAEKAQSNATKLNDKSLKVLKDAKTTVHSRIKGNEKTMTEAVGGFSTEVQQQTARLNESSHDGTYLFRFISISFSRYSRAKKARFDVTTRLNNDLQSHNESLRRDLGSVSENARNFADRTAATGSALADLTSGYQTASRSQLSTVQKATIALSEQGTKEDTPTGFTPRKRSWRYVDEWERTGDRQTLLRAWRQGTSALGSETVLAEHTSLPTNDSDLAAEETDVMNIEQSQSPVPSEPEVPVVNTLQFSSSSSSSSSTYSTLPPSSPTGSGGKAAQPPPIPLADTRNVYTTRGSRRRRV
ncbi:hypothetical protein D9757_001867 [Collybiopsis confluens]|uniref:Kinesin motor domain-containing protein n=1 Tax=Collybiopsis confluens TaxID=2823264 RepID=A0A8H5HXV7_9AGAR|nr:hypothetical protein D9757_001867 [Collybiopsis confluens]